MEDGDGVGDLSGGGEDGRVWVGEVEREDLVVTCREAARPVSAGGGVAGLGMAEVVGVELEGEEGGGEAICSVETAGASAGEEGETMTFG